MKNLEMIHKLSVLHCVYQLIASADGSIDDERDKAAIDLTLSELGLTASYTWESSLQLNPHDCFFHVSGFSKQDKQLLHSLLFKIAEMGGSYKYRMTCAKHILQLCDAY